MLNDLQEKIGYIFLDIQLLAEALMHPSIASKQKVRSYERLEFLGNSILGAALADIIFNTFTNAPEGHLSLILSKLSSTHGIVSTVQHLNIGQYILMAVGEEKSGGRDKARNIENCVEAIIGAIYLDGGYDRAKEFIKKFWLKKLVNISNIRDSKSRLQELCQKKYKTMPVYKITNREGPVHDPIFTIVCSVQINNNIFTAEAKHKTKKQAEQESAEKILSLIVN
jgi:ribonuclease-3